MLGALLVAQPLLAAPVAVNDVRTVTQGATITINVLANDYDPNGNSLSVPVSQTLSPSHGSAQVNSDGSIRYAPTAGYTGPDSFSYSILAGDESATGLVTINVVPVNLERLGVGRNNKSIGAVVDDLCARLQDLSDAELGSGGIALLERCQALVELSRTDPGAVDHALRQIAPEEVSAQIRQASEFFRSQGAAVAQRQAQLAGGYFGPSFNGYALVEGGIRGGAAGDESSPFSRFNFFASALHGDQERDETRLEAGYDTNVRGLTLGADYRVQDNLFVGLAGGWTQSDLEFSGQGGGMDTDIYSIISYAVWYQDALSLDLQLGYSATNYDTSRHIRYSAAGTSVDATAKGETSGSQWSLSSQVQWDFNVQGYSIRPFGRFDYLFTDIDGYGETNAAGWEIEIDDQQLSQLTLEAGLELSYAWSQSWGVLLPQGRISALSDVASSRDKVYGRFAFDTDPTNKFRIDNDGEESLYYMLNLGAVAVLPHGFSTFFQYRHMLGYSDLDASQITLGLRYEM